MIDTSQRGHRAEEKRAVCMMKWKVLPTVHAISESLFLLALIVYFLPLDYINIFVISYPKRFPNAKATSVSRSPWNAKWKNSRFCNNGLE